jgi:sensor histidine kinase YesM
MIAEVNQEKLIANIAYAFGNLMRYSLSREYFVLLQKEIEVVKQYIAIQKKRFANRFSVKWNIDALSQEWVCPKFILLFMVENAIVHNVPKTRKKIRIDIEIKQVDDNLSITVSNNGPGIPPKRLEEIQFLLEHPEERSGMSSQHNGRGIFNINDRLQLYYGKNYYLSLTSEENVKTVCNVRIHMRYKEMEENLYGGDIPC